MRRTGRGWLYRGIAVLVAVLLAVPAVVAAEKPRHRPAQAKPQAARPAPAPAPTTGPIATDAKHAIIVEAETNTVLFDKLAEERMPPASMSKMMTAYVVFSLLKEGRAKLTDELPVSQEAWKLGGSKMFVPVGGRIKIDDLIRGMIVQSGNDSCVVLAEGLAGSQDAFVDMMNAKAKEIGLTNSHFANVDGLPNPDHWMSARDLAILALRTMQDFPEYYHYYSEKDFSFNGIDQGNRNPLLYTTPGTDGLKTGHTEESGYSLTASVARGDRRIILVEAGLPSMKARGQEGARLAEWAFREFNNYKLFSAGDKVDDAEVWLGEAPKVPLVVKHDVVVTMPRRSRKDMKVTVSYTKPIEAPVREGQQVGKVAIAAPDVTSIELPLYTGGSVARIGTLGRMATVAAYLIWGNRH
ncbi:MAG TPA: D-alanyl-D-alanine carboxypeptidase family protein [Stellaceae bacterium]|nr:D-alanyl-D-alanine carboxypeptidase family protein [Stellaceae bacterium]